MPTYDYVCDACEHEFEQFQGINDELLKKCPECGKRKLRRLFGTGAAVVFKGSGFYQTDYRSESYKKGAASDSKSSAPASGDKTSGGEAPAKPSAKADGAKPTKPGGKKKG